MFRVIRSNASALFFAVLCLVTSVSVCRADDPPTEPYVDGTTTNLPAGQEIEITLVLPGTFETQNIDPSTITIIVEDDQFESVAEYSPADMVSMSIQHVSPTDETIVSVSCKFKITLPNASKTYKIFSSALYGEVSKTFDGVSVSTGN